MARHAGGGARARLTVAVADGMVHWEVSDDGGGAQAAAPTVPGHGLTGMRERVEILGGRLEAGPAGDGWRVCTRLPPLAVGVAAPAGARAPEPAP